jgi:hypothetical protein
MRRILLISLLLLAVSSAWATACPSGYTDRLLLTKPPTNLASDLTDFPIGLMFNGVTPANSYTLTDLKVTGSGGKIQSAGNDIVFCTAAAGGTLLSFERIFYDGSSGKLAVKVKQTVATASTTNVWMFYGKAADSDHSDPTGTYSNGYVEVWHLGDGTTLSVNGVLGSTGTNHGATATTGEVDGGATVASGSSQYIDSGLLQPSLTNYTLSAWLIQSDTTTRMAISSANAGQASGIFILFENALQLECGFRNAGALTRVTGITATGALQQIVCVHTSGSTTLTPYSNGVVSGSSHDTGASNPSATDNLIFGRDGAANTLYWNNKIDEVSLSNVVRSTDWVQAEYNSVANSSGFMSMVTFDQRTPAGLTAGTNCVPVIIDHTKVPNTDQTNFPLLVRGIFAWMADVADGGYAVNGNSGHDIRWFSNSTCTSALDFQRIFWTSTSGDSAWRVRVPTATTAADKTVYVKIGGTSDTTDLSTTWMTGYNYIGVYNGGSPTSLSPSDSGSANLTFTCGAHVFSAYTPVGGGFYFDTNQTDAAVCFWDPSIPGDSIGAHGYPVGSTVGHIRLLFQTTLQTAAQCDLYGNDCDFGGYGKANANGQRAIGWEHRATQSLGIPITNIETGGPAVLLQSAGTTPTFTMDQQWHSMEWDYGTAAGALTTSNLYFDGAPVTAPAYVSGATVINTDNTVCCTNNAEITLARASAHGSYRYTGFVTQFEVSNISRSADNVATRYNNELFPTTFYSFGTSAPVTSGSVRHRVTYQ